MSGHSHWATIKHKKAATDKKRGKAFNRVSKLILIAARNGGSDPDTNLSLRYAMDKAREVNMPVDTIKRLARRGAGEEPGQQIEELLLEGFAPGGGAVLVEAVTDNRNRTVPEVRKLFESHGGKLAGPNAVAWTFRRAGVVTVAAEAADGEKLLDLALEAGAEDLAEVDGAWQITAPPEAFLAVKDAVAAAGIAIASDELAFLPENEIEISGADAEKSLALLSALDDHDDVQNVSVNFQIPDEVAAKD